MKKIIASLIVLLLNTPLTKAQRYVSEVFTEIDITENVEYGVNASVLYIMQNQQAVPEHLTMDIYEPANDNQPIRPVVIIFHDGHFYPPQFNGGCVGSKKDADVVELATRLAKMGYVACAIDYRLGWEPANPDQTVRVFTLINAIYRGVQDSRTAVKFLKKSAADLGNPYGIDTDRIAMWGFGTGAAVTYASATLNSVEDTWIPKFETPVGPMIVDSINGDLNADIVGIVPGGYPPPFSEGDTLCYPNHAGYDASFQLSVQMGGACGDTSWVTPNDVPMISTHVITDPTAFCEIGLLNANPSVNLQLFESMGACIIIPLAVESGVNDIFNETYVDSISVYVAGQNGNIQGFFPMYSNDPSESAPWSFAYSSEPYGIQGSDCDTDQTDAAEVMDSVVQYFIPRACLALNLGCDLTYYLGFSSGSDQLEENQVGLTVAPNPASDYINFTTKSEPIKHLYIFDMTGKLIGVHDNINSNNFNLSRGSLPQGMYMALLGFDDGYISKKIVFGN
jgi:BD-FAE protein/type IX secretion system substrate protein